MVILIALLESAQFAGGSAGSRRLGRALRRRCGVQKSAIYTKLRRTPMSPRDLGALVARDLSAEYLR